MEAGKVEDGEAVDLASFPDIRGIPADLEAPPAVTGEPAPGRRVRRTLPIYAGTAVHHTLYLPADWTAGKRFPVIAEYPGNGPFSNGFGDTCSGMVEDCNLGFGMSGGRGFIWVCLPFVDSERGENRRQWWGDPDATAAYAAACVKDICAGWGGDPDMVVLSGFSRGSLACNYIGLRDEETARLWRGFVCHSHYDGVRPWDYPGCGRADAAERLGRLAGRPQFISHEGSVDKARRYLEEACPDGDFTFVSIPYRNHTDAWVLRDIPERRIIRKWLAAMTGR